MRILLTGANGFVGSHVLEALFQAGHSLTLLLRESTDTDNIGPLLAHCRVCPGSLADPGALYRACEGAEGIVHCAGRTRAVRSAEFMESNAEGTRRLMRAVKRSGDLRHVVLISSLAATGPAGPGRPARDEDLPHPVSAYGRSKLAGEKVLKYEAKVPWTILRPPMVYGPRDRELLPLFRWILAGHRPLLPCPSQPLSLIHAADLATAVAACVDAPACFHKIYHVAHPDWVTPAQIVKAISPPAARRVDGIPRPLLWGICAAVHLESVLTGKPRMVNLYKWPELRAPGWVCESKRFCGDTDFEPAIQLGDGIRMTIEDYRARACLPPWKGP